MKERKFRIGDKVRVGVVDPAWILDHSRYKELEGRVGCVTKFLPVNNSEVTAIIYYYFVRFDIDSDEFVNSSDLTEKYTFTLQENELELALDEITGVLEIADSL